MAPPVELPDGIQLSTSNWDESKLMQAAAPPTTGKPMLKHHRVSSLKSTNDDDPIGGNSRRRSVQFAPVLGIAISPFL